MKALRFSEATGLELAEVPIPEPQGTEALIRVKRAAICSTDLEILRGYVPGYNQVGSVLPRADKCQLQDTCGFKGHRHLLEPPDRAV